MMKSMNIHFVCRGNVLRSHIAEAYLKSLELKDVAVTSSGTVADEYRESNREFIINARDLLVRHGLSQFVKDVPEQLTQDRLTGQDIVVLMNQIVHDEAMPIVVLPKNTIYWNIIDVGEGDRTIESNRLEYEEIIYQEVTNKVDDLVAKYNLK